MDDKRGRYGTRIDPYLFKNAYLDQKNEKELVKKCIRIDYILICMTRLYINKRNASIILRNKDNKSKQMPTSRIWCMIFQDICRRVSFWLMAFLR